MPFVHLLGNCHLCMERQENQAEFDLPVPSLAPPDPPVGTDYMQLVAHTLADRDGLPVGKSRTPAKSARVA